MRFQGAPVNRLAALLPNEIPGSAVSMRTGPLRTLTLCVRPHPGILHGFINGHHESHPGYGGVAMHGAPAFDRTVVPKERECRTEASTIPSPGA
jgi:hypothetical protein